MPLRHRHGLTAARQGPAGVHHLRRAHPEQTHVSSSSLVAMITVQADSQRRTAAETSSAAPQRGALDHEVAERLEGGPGRARTAGPGCARAPRPSRRRSSRAAFMAGWARSSASASACSVVIGRAGRGRAARAAARRAAVRRAQRVQHRQRVHALAQVGARRLARLGRLRGDVEDVVGELEGDAELLARRRQCARRFRRRARRTCAPNRPDVAISDPVFSVTTRK